MAWAGEPGYTTTVTLAEDIVPHQSAYITSYLAYLRSLDLLIPGRDQEAQLLSFSTAIGLPSRLTSSIR